MLGGEIEGQRGDDRVAWLHARSQCGTLEAEDVRRMAKSRWATFALAEEWLSLKRRPCRHSSNAFF